jgi:hypothetical protein
MHDMPDLIRGHSPPADDPLVYIEPYIFELPEDSASLGSTQKVPESNAVSRLIPFLNRNLKISGLPDIDIQHR